MEPRSEYKVKDVFGHSRRTGFGAYRDLCYGDVPIFRVLLGELVVLFMNWVPGALGIGLRMICYPILFKNVVFGRHLTFRHPHKIRIGNNVIIDDNAVIDAKGDSNQGIIIEDNIYIGRNTIVYCKNGDITLQRGVNLSSNCQIFSSNKLTIRPDTVVGAYSYFLSGGEYDYTDREHTFSEQSGTISKSELVIGANCWLAARVTVIDGASIGDHCVIGAGAVVTRPIPADSLAVGVPARVIKQI